jgi:hypothetical protein
MHSEIGDEGLRILLNADELKKEILLRGSPPIAS